MARARRRRPRPSAASEARDVAVAHYAALAARDLDAYVATLDPDVVATVNDTTISGAEELRGYVATAFEVVPELRIGLLRVIAECGDTVIAEVGVGDAAQGVTHQVLRVRRGRITAIESHFHPHPDDVMPAGLPTRVAASQVIDEQASLRRVATLVARGVAPEEVFAAVSEEASRLFEGVATALLRYEEDGVATCVAAGPGAIAVGTRVRDVAARAAVAAPITVEGRVWGVVTASTADGPLPEGTEQRLTEFAELVAAGIASTEARAQLSASRARVIATADETRRRLQRDVHDGAQQRLVQSVITLELAREALAGDDGPVAQLVDESLDHVRRAAAELRDLVRGILPASLTRGGLAAGIESLAGDLRFPVVARVTVPRLPAALETTAYFVVAEALTNVVKHAGATHAEVGVDTDGPTLTILVRDDGCGGADPARGSGLTGLRDRVEAAEGTLEVTSPLGAGTSIRASLPVPVP